MSYTSFRLSDGDYDDLNENVYTLIAEMNDNNRNAMDRRDAATSAVQIMNFMAEMAYVNGDDLFANTIIGQRNAHMALYPQFYGTICLCVDSNISLTAIPNLLTFHCFRLVGCFPHQAWLIWQTTVATGMVPGGLIPKGGAATTAP